MRLAGGLGEGGRGGEQEGALLRQRAVELREAHVVADGEADPAPGRVGQHGLVTAGDGVGLAVFLARRQVDVEQMDLAVARGDPALGIDEEFAVGGLGVADLDGERADQQPDAELFGQRAEGGERGIVRLVIAARQLRAAIGRHQRGVLRRGDELRAFAVRLTNEFGGDADVLRDVVGRAQLDAGGFEGGHAGDDSAEAIRPIAGRACPGFPAHRDRRCRRHGCRR